MKKNNKRAAFLLFALSGLIFSTAVIAAQIDLGSYGTVHENSSSSNFQIYGQIADPAVGRVTSSNYILEHYFTMSTTTYNHCFNSIKDYDEVQIDCGGSMCQSCTFHCSNSVKDYDETGVDCGGIFCPACDGGGGGGGCGGGGPITSSIIIPGKTAPSASIKVLKDGILMATILADSSGNFTYSASGLSGGNYRYSLYYDDDLSLRSATLDIPVTIVSGRTLTLGAVLLPVTIGTDKSQVKRGDTVEIGGMTAPGASVFITVSSLAGKTFNYPVLAGPDGKYLFRFETGEMDYDTYHATAYATLGALRSKNSLVAEFKVGEETETTKPGDKCQLKADVNYDCRVNLVDFSITAYWFIREISPEFLIIEADKLSNDGKITLTDFSILAYYWTG